MRAWVRSSAPPRGVCVDVPSDSNVNRASAHGALVVGHTAVSIHPARA
ncbi:hypothetical protein K788_0002423 [Paraburkholderia caribensis MBA4]|uniref:Uncharacterized protein n=1 Tax=Paraburkholderia caribensis MBA4 TaxID=1323664 RepID=A0A0P0R9S2_9BURK|nr:hypothetical protein K788_0002423 [Paraburkholderia caribensis MBA4]